jgi:hypothetical protein
MDLQTKCYEITISREFLCLELTYPFLDFVIVFFFVAFFG